MDPLGAALAALAVWVALAGLTLACLLFPRRQPEANRRRVRWPAAQWVRT